MHVNTETADRLAVQRLLADLANRLNGPVDFWTVEGLGTMPIDRRGFLVDKSQQLQSVVVEITKLATASFQHRDLGPLLESMKAGCLQLEEAFLVLGRFRRVGLQKLHSATDSILRSYHGMHQYIIALVCALGLEDPEPVCLNAERKRYFAMILDNLFDTVRFERDAAAAATGNY
jgi:hypothetical protein